jgi:nitrate/TMAO reductase-like tetraheme cytochrome c subunit
MMRMVMAIMVIVLSACSQSEREADVSMESGNLILTRDHGGSGSAWGLADCDSCHVLDDIHQRADLIRGITRQKGYATCTGCHGDNGSNQARQCVICHNANDLASAPMLDGAHSHNFTEDATGGLADQSCLDCHWASDMDGHFDVNRDLSRLGDELGRTTEYQSVSEFCLRCHNRDHQQSEYPIEADYDDPLIAIQDAYLYIDQHGEVDGSGTRTYAGLRDGYHYASEVECTDCHAMHGTDNGGLVIDRSLKGLSQLDEALRAADYPISIEGGNTTQLCVMCHEMDVVVDQGDQNAGNGLAGVHEISGDCLLCHSHGEAVQAGM